MVYSQKMELDDKNETIQKQQIIIEQMKKKDVSATQKNRKLKVVREKIRRYHIFKKKHPVFIPKKSNTALKCPELTAQRRAIWNIKHNKDMIGNTFIWMTELSKECGKYEECLSQKYQEIFEEKTNEEITERRAKNAGYHFIDIYNNKMSQRGHQSLRNTLIYKADIPSMCWNTNLL